MIPVICYVQNAPSPVLSITESSLRGHLSFIASDLLEGRATPSRGLDLAAEYIAAQFRRAGLTPGGEKGTFFQTSQLAPRGSDKLETVRNVVGVLPGSDPVLKDTYVLVTAHYDHLGKRDAPEGEDGIYNGANDDGSGTVGVIELAGALAALKTRPKRTLVFMTFFGEERGLLGSRFYGKNPLFSLEKTVAHINLEQIGRTDDAEGARVGALSMTGYDYSDIGPIFSKAAGPVGIKVEKHPRFSDAFFARSDNQALADLGIPAHTLCTAFVYPDYHGAGDHWEKIDYKNMASVLQGAALGLLALANSPTEPHWSATNPRASRYLAAWQKSHEVVVH